MGRIVDVPRTIPCKSYVQLLPSDVFVVDILIEAPQFWCSTLLLTVLDYLRFVKKVCVCEVIDQLSVLNFDPSSLLTGGFLTLVPYVFVRTSCTLFLLLGITSTGRRGGAHVEDC